MGSNHRPSGYEPDELPLLYSAPLLSFETKASAKVLLFIDICKYFCKKVLKNTHFCQNKLKSASEIVGFVRFLPCEEGLASISVFGAFWGRR